MPLSTATNDFISMLPPPAHNTWRAAANQTVVAGLYPLVRADV